MSLRHEAQWIVDSRVGNWCLDPVAAGDELPIVGNPPLPVLAGQWWCGFVYIAGRLGLVRRPHLPDDADVVAQLVGVRRGVGSVALTRSYRRCRMWLLIVFDRNGSASGHRDGHLSAIPDVKDRSDHDAA
jgi:hypothetical protein